MNTPIFLAALPSFENNLQLTEKISACEAKRSPLVKIQWTHAQDLHITLGYIPGIAEKDISIVAMSMASISQISSFMAQVGEVKLYGNAIVLRMHPYPRFLNIHDKMQQKLLAISNHQYQFDMQHKYDPHLTVGRIKNMAAINAAHKMQLLNLIAEKLRSFSFLIQQAALMRRVPENTIPVYEKIKLYTLTR